MPESSVVFAQTIESSLVRIKLKNKKRDIEQRSFLSVASRAFSHKAELDVRVTTVVSLLLLLYIL